MNIGKGKRQTQWRSRAHGVWFRLCAVCLSVYIGYITYFVHSGFLKSAGRSVAALACFALFSLLVYGALCAGCRRLSGCAPKSRPRRKDVDLRVYGLAFGIALFIFGCTFAACYPGGVNYDVSNQWRQAHSGEFNNWHPVFHTLLIWLVTRVRDSYSFGVVVQLVVFAALMARLPAVLHKHGVPAWLALTVHGITAASLPVRNTLMYLGKDSVMTMGVLVLTAQTFEILFTKGEWLKKPLRAVSMGLALGVVTLTRINALLWVAPYLACLFFAWKPLRRRTALAACVMLALLAIIEGPVYGALDVVYPDNTVEEMVGLPMTVLGDTKQREPDKLDAETSAFLATLASEEAWQNTYTLHSYNSIKFTYERELIKNTPLSDILSMALRSAAAAPRTAFEAVNGLTDLVWDVTGQDEGYRLVRNSGDIAELQFKSEWLNRLGEKLSKAFELPMQLAPLRWLTCNIGVQLLLLLLTTLWALYRRGVRALVLALPTLLYNLGTMLLLCGNDARFFHFSMTVSLAAILCLMYLPEQKNN